MALKGRIDFEQQTPEEETVSINTQQLFDEQTKFEVMAEESETALSQIVTAEPASKKRPRRWALKTALVGFLGLAAWQSVDQVITAYSQADWLTLGWSGLAGFLSLWGAQAVGREWWYLKRLRHRQVAREEGERLLAKEGIGEAKGYCQRIVSAEAKKGEGYDQWLHALSGTHNDREVLEMFDSMVLREQDEQARRLVAKHAKEAGLMVAVSPLATADMLLVAWRTFSMVNRLCDLYGVELSYVSRIAMIKKLIRNMAFVGATEIAIDASMDMLSMDLTGKVSARAGQGLGVGLLTARLGLKTMAMLRPLPWLGDVPLKMSDVRKDLLKEMRLLKGRKEPTE
ncbi:YcjF family protein [Thaumasiovibrio subtropicus]|uniref:YcjF family protein n=1 Tax=Thaumasiovibrio subtropicus TaxID=1891207 RepID=UPI000B351D5B|nr:TIGR01620 family protein [Thaumasiovibrio subtropicus]